MVVVRRKYVRDHEKLISKNRYVRQHIIPKIIEVYRPVEQYMFHRVDSFNKILTNHPKNHITDSI